MFMMRFRISGSPTCSKLTAFRQSGTASGNGGSAFSLGCGAAAASAVTFSGGEGFLVSAQVGFEISYSWAHSA